MVVRDELSTRQRQNALQAVPASWQPIAGDDFSVMYPGRPGFSRRHAAIKV